MDEKEIDAAFDNAFPALAPLSSSVRERGVFSAGAEFGARKEAEEIAYEARRKADRLPKSEMGMRMALADLSEYARARHAQPQGQEKQVPATTASHAERATERQDAAERKRSGCTQTPAAGESSSSPIPMTEARVREIACEVDAQSYRILRATIQETDDYAKALERRVAAVEEICQQDADDAGFNAPEPTPPPAAGADRGEKERAVIEAARKWHRDLLRSSPPFQAVSDLDAAVSALDAKPEGKNKTAGLTPEQRAAVIGFTSGDSPTVREMTRAAIAGQIRDAEAAARADERRKVLEEAIRANVIVQTVNPDVWDVIAAYRAALRSMLGESK